jgi:O-antigen ligase
MTSNLKSDRIRDTLVFLIVVTFAAFLLYVGKGNALPLLVISTSFVMISLLIVFREHIPLLFLIGAFFILRNPPGINPGEVLFYSVAFVTIIGVLIPDIVRFRLPLVKTLDKAFFALHLLVIYALLLSIIYGNNIDFILADLLVYSAIIAYFPLRKYLNSEKRIQYFEYASIGILIAIGIRNLINYREFILRAVMSWEVELARTAVNEILIVFGCVLVLVLACNSKKLHQFLIFGTILGFLLINLILTQSRGFWVMYVLSIGLYFILSERREKTVLVLIHGGGVIIGTSVLLLFFQEQLELILLGLTVRFSTFGQVGEDLSLLQRVIETEAVFGKILTNPINGFGFGAEYARQNILEGNIYEAWVYIHNGYLAIWYKMGVVGLITYAFIYGSVIKYSFKIYKASTNINHRNAALTIFCTVTVSLLINITSPHFNMFDGLLFISAAGAYVTTLYNKLELAQNDKI